MHNYEMSPKESLELINRMISGARARVHENGFIYRFWGWLILVCALAQFGLMLTGHPNISYYPYFLVIPGAIYTFFSEWRKHNKQGSPNYTSVLMAAIWIAAAVNLLIVGFVFSPVLKMSPVPHILIILAIATITSGVAIRFRPLVAGGIVCNAAGIVAVFVSSIWHPVLIAAGIVAADLIPGYILRSKFKKYYA